MKGLEKKDLSPLNHMILTLLKSLASEQKIAHVAMAVAHLIVTAGSGGAVGI